MQASSPLPTYGDKRQLSLDLNWSGTQCPAASAQTTFEDWISRVLSPQLSKTKHARRTRIWQTLSWLIDGWFPWVTTLPRGGLYWIVLDYTFPTTERFSDAWGKSHGPRKISSEGMNNLARGSVRLFSHQIAGNIRNPSPQCDGYLPC